MKDGFSGFVHENKAKLPKHWSDWQKAAELAQWGLEAGFGGRFDIDNPEHDKLVEESYNFLSLKAAYYLTQVEDFRSIVQRAIKRGEEEAYEDHRSQRHQEG